MLLPNHEGGERVQDDFRTVMILGPASMIAHRQCFHSRVFMNLQLILHSGGRKLEKLEIEILSSQFVHEVVENFLCGLSTYHVSAHCICN